MLAALKEDSTTLACGFAWREAAGPPSSVASIVPIVVYMGASFGDLSSWREMARWVIVTVVEVNVAQNLVPVYAACGSRCMGCSAVRRVADSLTCHGHFDSSEMDTL